MVSLVLQSVPLLALAQPENSQVARQGTFSRSLDDDEKVTDVMRSPIPPAIRAEMERVNEARQQDPDNPYGLGFDAPEKDAIRMLLSNIEEYRDDLTKSDFEKLEAARLSAFSRNYVTNAVLDSCRSFLAMNGNYASRENMAEQFAGLLMAMDQAETADLTSAFSRLLPVVSAEARRFLFFEKSKIHHGIGSATIDWQYMAEQLPDFMIEQQLNYCSGI